MNHPPSLLILSHDVVGSQMAGPGIRYYHLARVLARELPVTLAVPGHSTNDLDFAWCHRHHLSSQMSGQP